MSEHEDQDGLERIVARVAANPGETYDFIREGQPMAVLIGHQALVELREAAGVSTDLELALDAVLSRYKIQMFGFPNGGDRGDLVSDLAEVARDYFGRGRR